MSDLQGSWLGLALEVLAVWRVTHLLHAEHGPWGSLARLRAAATRRGLGELTGCFWCLSVWTALPFALWSAPTWRGRVVVWLALSAGAILVEVRGDGGDAREPKRERPHKGLG
jgi:hypothetical protein